MYNNSDWDLKVDNLFQIECVQKIQKLLIAMFKTRKNKNQSRCCPSHSELVLIVTTQFSLKYSIVRKRHKKNLGNSEINKNMFYSKLNLLFLLFLFCAVIKLSVSKSNFRGYVYNVVSWNFNQFTGGLFLNYGMSCVNPKVLIFVNS